MLKIIIPKSPHSKLGDRPCCSPLPTASEAPRKPYRPRYAHSLQLLSSPNQNLNEINAAKIESKDTEKGKEEDRSIVPIEMKDCYLHAEKWGSIGDEPARIGDGLINP